MTEDTSRTSLHLQLGCDYLAGYRVGRRIMLSGAMCGVAVLLLGTPASQIGSQYVIDGASLSVGPFFDWLIIGVLAVSAIVILAGVTIDIMVGPWAAVEVVRGLDFKYPDGSPPKGWTL